MDLIVTMKDNNMIIEDCLHGEISVYDFIMDVLRSILLCEVKIRHFDDIKQDIMVFTFRNTKKPIITSSVSKELLPKFFVTMLLEIFVNEFKQD